MFITQKGDNSVEIQCVALYCSAHRIDRRVIRATEISRFASPNSIPVGSVEFVESFLNRNITPDYWPDFLEKYLHRKVLKWTTNPPSGWFVKPACGYKLFDGHILTEKLFQLKPRGVYSASEIVKFDNEWRYYVADGEVLATGWYSGDDDNKPAPELNIEWPKGYCGAVDFGETEKGITLVEAHHPYACGWYCGLNDYEIYVDWIKKGWKYMQAHEKANNLLDFSREIIREY